MTQRYAAFTFARGTTLKSLHAALREIIEALGWEAKIRSMVVEDAGPSYFDSLKVVLIVEVPDTGSAS